MNVVGNKILVETALGTLVVCTGGDAEHPEIFVDLHREGFKRRKRLWISYCKQQVMIRAAREAQKAIERLVAENAAKDAEITRITAERDNMLCANCKFFEHDADRYTNGNGSCLCQKNWHDCMEYDFCSYFEPTDNTTR